ncbi:hypothetical protein C474_11546 [Halogeometricum pallidum JCM 14848]|uniref:DUF7344 domain-containing protein n=1 Tax=Halogeometricum pallidum JCM 14848 TaxID=1227487 RepID=M0D8G3_HALPD|nr:helix-turn-helix transcriptional regulator [Halogeometricum pallidum]ELZ30444.1 hypothetical protein C474_11546 [Halogeometricum pallidum JCM 14848]
MTNSQSIHSDTRLFDTVDASALDERLEALSHRRRRHVLQCLEEGRTPLTLAELANEVAKRDRDATQSGISAEEVEKVRVVLYHLHLPKLRDADLVAYDRENDSITLSSEIRRE